MKKQNYLYLILLIVIIVSLSIYVVAPKYATISINNNTNTIISGLKIKYTNSPTDEIQVPEILEKKSADIKLDLPKNFTEGFIKICYIDKQGMNKEEYIEGYIEKGYSRNRIINIQSIDENGILSIDYNK
jgi:hypothetical protein